MTWDAAKGVSRRPRAYGLDVFQPLDSLYRARRSANVGAYAAGGLAVSNLLSALRVFFEHLPVTAWLAQGSLEVTLVCLAATLAAAWLCVTIMRRQPLWACVVILIWAGIEPIRWLTFHLYGHMAMRGLPSFALAAAVVGVRGALALRRLERENAEAILPSP